MTAAHSINRRETTKPCARIIRLNARAGDKIAVQLPLNKKLNSNQPATQIQTASDRWSRGPALMHTLSKCIQFL